MSADRGRGGARPGLSRISAVAITVGVMTTIGVKASRPGAAGEGASMTRAEQIEAADREAILGHIHSIFRAYLEKDRAALEATHTTDWIGFTVSAEGLVRGIEGYMRYADGVLATSKPLGYELLDTEVLVHGDVAIVYYLARYSFLRDGEERTVRLRSVDVYRRERGEWIQSGSNICPTPTDAVAATANHRELPADELAALLETRERVWRAWFGGDEAALGELIPPEAISIDAGAERWGGREQILEGSREFARSGARLARLEFPETRVQAYGPVAIIYTRFVFEIAGGDGPAKRIAGRGTEVFVKRAGRWVNSGWHLDSGS